MTELTEELKQQYQNYDQYDLNNAFILACKHGHLDIVKYLLTSPDLKEHANIHADGDDGFVWACKIRNLEIIIYLLSFNEEQCIDFQRTQYNLDWAIENKYNDVIIPMMDNLKNNNPFEYIECLTKIEMYNKELYEQITSIKCEISEVNSSSETVLFM